MFLSDAAPEPIITAVTHDFEHFTLYDGNHRSILLYLRHMLNEKEHRMVELLLGYSPNFGRNLPGNFYCLGHGAPAVPISKALKQSHEQST